MRLVYTRRRDRLHALISPKKRQRLEMMQEMVDFFTEKDGKMTELMQQMTLDQLIWGCAHIKPHLHSSDER